MAKTNERQRQTKLDEDRVLFKKHCRYIGSIAVTLPNNDDGYQFVNEKLMEMTDIGVGVSVVLMITDEGVKVLKDNESAVKMAHGITRIAFSTCQPEQKLFAYVAKNMSSTKTVITQAHMFKTKKKTHSQQLSSHLAKAFTIANARDTMRRKNRDQLFESEAEEQKATSEIQNRGKRWAKIEMSHGHEHSSHAMKARQRYSSDIEKFIKELRINEKRDNGSQTISDQKESESVIDNSHKSVAIIAANSVDSKKDSENASKDNPVDKQNLSSDTSEQNQVQGKTKIMVAKKHWSSGDDIITLNIPACRDTTSNMNMNIVSPTSRFVDGISVEQDTSLGYQNVVLNQNRCSNDFLREEPTQEVLENGSNDSEIFPRERVVSSRFTVTEEDLLKNSEWFQAGFSREITETILKNRSTGSFFVRNSLSHPGSYVMSIKVPQNIKSKGVAHFLIKQNKNSFFYIKGFTLLFPALTDLVAHYGSTKEDIPVQLRLAHDNPLFFTRLYLDQPDNVDTEMDNDDPDYEIFSSNEEIMKELQSISQ